MPVRITNPNDQLVAIDSKIHLDVYLDDTPNAYTADRLARIFAGGGRDIIHGSWGNDGIWGQDGADFLYGEGGDTMAARATMSSTARAVTTYSRDGKAKTPSMATPARTRFMAALTLKPSTAAPARTKSMGATLLFASGATKTRTTCTATPATTHSTAATRGR